MMSHLFFADDSLLFYKATRDGTESVIQALNLYSRASGQVINFAKSGLTFSPGATRGVINMVQTKFGVQVVQSHNIYLGLPTFMMKKRRVQFEYLAERAASKVGGWMNKTFSTGGKEVLIKSVVQSIPTYTMACFRVPISVCNNIERSCARFWWGDKENERHMHWMTWKSLCKPKSRGGMGFRSLVDFNQALLAKQLWRLIRNPTSLVAQLLKAKYYPEVDVMDVKKTSNCSFTWRSLLWGRELLKKGLKWKIGDGEDVRVFGDSWLPDLAHGKMIQRPFGLEDYRVARLLDDSKQWDRGKMKDILLPIEIEEVLKVDRADSSARDVRYWRFDPKGEYSVKSGYLVASNFYEPHPFQSEVECARWWKYLWSFDLPPRVRIFAWRVFQNLIPTEINLHNHHVPIVGRCGWCRKGWGTTAHTLLYCEKVRPLWTKFEFWNLLKKWEGADVELIGGAMMNKVSREAFEKWLMGLWLVWKALCDEKHNERKPQWQDLEEECKVYIEGYAAAKKQASTFVRVLPKEGSCVWTRPRRGRVRLDVDYAVDDVRGRGGVGAIARDENDRILFALSKPVQLSATILHGELKALVHGIRQCVEDDISPVEAYTDSILAVHVIAEEDEAASVLCEDMFDFFKMVKNLNVISVSHARRDANKAAHELARFARSLESTCVWHDHWPLWLSNIVSDDFK